jgi:hypothetical protein
MVYDPIMYLNILVQRFRTPPNPRSSDFKSGVVFGEVMRVLEKGIFGLQIGLSFENS